MPCVGVRITKDDVTAGQKRWVVEEITRTLVNVLVKRPGHIHLVIDEVDVGEPGLRRDAHD